MSPLRRTLFVSYLVIAAIALVACWRQNLLFMAGTEGTAAESAVAFWPALFVNHAAASITIDIFLFGAAGVIWMVGEGRRLGMRGIWLYPIFGMLVAISVTFPLFLAMRERRLAELAEPATHLALGDRIGLVVFALPIVVFALATLAF